MVPLILLTVTATSAMQLDSADVRFEAFQTFSSTKGSFGRVLGDFQIDPAHPDRSKVTVRIEAASIDTGSDGRDDHLRNADFFDVKKHPQIIFRVQKIEPIAQKRIHVDGVLQIKGKKIPLRFNLNVDREKLHVFGRFSVSRKALGIDHQAPFYLPSIKDNVNVEVEAYFKPR